MKLLVLASLLAIAVGASASPTPFKRIFAPTDQPTNPYERPFRTGVSLNGSWDFQPVTNDLPAPKPDGWEKTKLKVPSPWNVNAFPTESRLGGDFRAFPSYPESWEKVQAGWLRRSFTVAPKNNRIILRFDAIAGDARILVNGKEVARHFDIFLPFEVDITDAVHRGDNQLLVGVRKASLTDVQGKYGRRTYQGGSMWGQAIAGIWQDVTLHTRPAVRVDDVFINPDVANGTLTAKVTLRNDAATPKRVKLDGDVLPWINEAGTSILDAPEPRWKLGKTILKMDHRAEDRNGIVVPAHGTIKTSLAVRVAGRLKPWAPGTPNLYSLICRIDGDTKTTRFGWRQLTFDGTKVLLNGKPLIMRGDSWHFLGIPQMTRRYAWAWFKTLQDAGLNAVRLHAEPYPSFYLDMADEMGILVLDETAIWASDGGPKLDDPVYWADTQRHLTDLIHRDRNHPSVFGWSVSNEVMAVVRNVFHAPKEIEDQANQMNGIWAAICRKEDPTRIWISADGEEDGNGQLPVSVIHYGDRSTMNRAIARNKPWGVGEAGPAYYGSPKQIAEMAKDPSAYLSFADRMRGVAQVSYQSLRDQNELGGSYRSVFNLVWYGLKPLALGLRDTTIPPELSDGISFPAFVEGQPGVQPERLGPYCSTLNPGYDPTLPLYETWPLFDAIKAAARGDEYATAKPDLAVGTARRGWTIPFVRVLGNSESRLAKTLSDLGVKVQEDSLNLVIDGAHPPGPETRDLIENRLTRGASVTILGITPEGLPAINAFLPERLELTSRQATSLIAVPGAFSAGISPSDLYFSEQGAMPVLSGGLTGSIMTGARAAFRASDTDWRRWNNQGETVKTAMVMRSEREAKTGGIALATRELHGGELILSSLTLPTTPQATALTRTILGNLGFLVGQPTGPSNVVGIRGSVPEVLALGPFSAESVEASLAHDRDVKEDQPLEGKNWEHVTPVGEGYLPIKEGPAVSETYCSFWVYSPKSLDNLLLDPHLPVMGLMVETVRGSRIWLNGKVVKPYGLPLQAGWNHFLVKIVRTKDLGAQPPAIRFAQFITDESTVRDFSAQLRISAVKPE